MSFRDLTLQDKTGLPTEESNLLQSVLMNQSPIMKVWFVIMVLNLAMFLFIIH